MTEATIERGRIYRLPEFQKLAGMGRYALASAIEKGLPVRIVGRWRYVMGDDWHDWLASRPTATAKAAKA